MLSSVEENSIMSTFQRLSNIFEIGDFNESNEPLKDAVQPLFQRHSKAKQQMTTKAKQQMTTRIRTIKGRNDPVFVDSNMHGERVIISFPAFVLRIGKQILPFRQKSMNK